MNGGAALYRLLGDEARLRLLRLLDRQPLNVSELTAILGLAQSGISRHLGLLKDAGVVTERREAGFTYHAIDRPGEASGLAASLAALLDAQFRQMDATPAAKADDARLQEVLRLRQESFRAHGSEERQLVPGRSWAAWARALGLLLPPVVVADLGCGEGYLTIEIARWAKHVTAIDRSSEVLQRARDLARRRRATNISWKRGELEHLPLGDATVDVAVLSQALHHAASPAAAMAEAVRVVAPGGSVLVLDLRTHGEQWVKDRLGDRWPGFDDEELAALLHRAGLSNVEVRVGARRTGDPFTVLIARGIRRSPKVRGSGERLRERAR